MSNECFIKLTRHDYANEIDWVVDILILSLGLTPMMEQYNTRCGIQAGLVENNRSLIREGYQAIDEELSQKMIEDKNWKNLCHGLALGSAKTLEWLSRHGIRTNINDTYAHEPHPTHQYKLAALPDDLDIAF